jgi:hypothetical protein
MAKEVEHNIDNPTAADYVMLDKESERDDDQESEEIVDETVNAPTPKRQTKSQGKKTFIIPEARIRRMNQHPPRVASVAPRRVPSISVVYKTSSPSPHVRVRQRSLRPTGAGDQLNTSQSPLAVSRGGRADHDAARTKTARGAVTSRPTEAAMQPSMDACACIHQAQDHSWRPYVLRTPDAAMRISPPHVYHPWQVF